MDRLLLKFHLLGVSVCFKLCRESAPRRLPETKSRPTTARLSWLRRQVGSLSNHVPSFHAYAFRSEPKYERLFFFVLADAIDQNHTTSSAPKTLHMYLRTRVGKIGYAYIRSASVEGMIIQVSFTWG